MMAYYAILPHIEVQAANLHTSGLLLGGAPIMAANLFAHAICRRLGVQDTGVIYIHHDRQDLGSFAYGRFTPAQRRGSVFINKSDYSSKNPHALSLQPTASCHLRLSLLVRLEARRVPRLAKLRACLANARFAGGQIIGMGEVQLVSAENLHQILHQTIKHGFVVIDRQDVLTAYQRTHRLDRLQAFTRLLALTPTGLAHAFGKQHALVFLSATNVGYALLEPPTEARTGVRQAYDINGDMLPTAHAYAEPLLGLVQYVSIQQLFALTKPQADDNNHADASTANDGDEATLANPIAEPLRQLAAKPNGLFWRYGWQDFDGGAVFLLHQGDLDNPTH